MLVLTEPTLELGIEYSLFGTGKAAEGRQCSKQQSDFYEFHSRFLKK
jgi:hypothetical protein